MTFPKNTRRIFNHVTILGLVFVSAFAIYSPAFSQTSLIENFLEARRSLVGITAVHMDIRKFPKAQAAIDPKTGRILVARGVRAVHFQKRGAGIIISQDGLIVTNLHIVRGANQIGVLHTNGKTYWAKLLHVMPKHDLVLLKINTGFPLQPIAFIDSNTVHLGDEVYNIGSSELLKGTISGGIIKGLGTSYLKSNPDLKSVEMIKVHMNLYKGDSGGPLFNQDGKLIGIMMAKQLSKDKVSFALPSNKVKKLYLDFVK